MSFLDIPVYRVPGDAYHQETKDEVEGRVQDFRDAHPGVEPDHLARWRHRYNPNQAPYRYNQVVGWISLRHSVGHQPGEVIAQGFKVPQKRIRRRFVLSYQPIGELLYLKFGEDESADIAAAIRQAVVNLQCPSQPFHGRNIDLDAFDSIAPFLDWRGLLLLQTGP